MVNSTLPNHVATKNFFPSAFEQALLQIGESDGFSDVVIYAAEQSGCEFLFEVPGSLFNREDGRAAVIRSCPTGSEGENCILYIIFDGDDGVIRILEEFEVPNSIQAMTHSYSKVLEYLSDLPGSIMRPLH